MLALPVRGILIKTVWISASNFYLPDACHVFFGDAFGRRVPVFARAA
jgi:hypothetical protein